MPKILDREGLSFDDVLLAPQHTEILPNEVDTSTKIANNLSLSVPVLTAPMDTVTESRMAIAMAREGGLGIIHRNMSIEKQAFEVDRVKRSEHGVILKPISLSADHTIQDAVDLMERYHISGVPITDENGRLVGILTNRDIRFETEYNRMIREVMTSENLVTAGEGTTLDQAQVILQKHRIEKLPIVDSNYKLTGLITIKDLLKLKQFPLATKDSKGRLCVGAAIGALRNPIERTEALVEAGVDCIVIDAAHGDSKGVLTTTTALKKKFPDLVVISGNVATKDGVKALIDAGANGLRIGIGAGSICTTRVVAGVGIPQLTAIMDCAEEANKHNIPTLADGGIRFTGDVVKALASGASAVMMGNMFAGCDEAPGEVEMYRNRAYKVYRGMGSIAAMKEGSSDRYYQMSNQRLVPEGIEGRVPYKGPISETIVQLIGGLRSGMGYLGARTLEELRDKAQFIKITNAGLRESHPHDVIITKEPPNYSSEWAGSSEDRDK